MRRRDFVLRGVVGALAGLVLAANFAMAGGIEDANLRDFPRLAGETDDAPRFRRAIAAAPDGVLAVPNGEYEIATMLYVTNRCSLLMHPNALLKAVAKMNYVVFWDGHDDYHALSVFDAAVEKELLSKGLPEMLKGSIAFDIRAGGSIFDGCYADTAEIGFNICSDTTIRSSGFFNNRRMGLRKSTVVVHRGGFATVDGCVFNGPARVEKLYEGTGKNLVWRNVRAFNGDGMARDSAKLSAKTGI